MAFLDKTGLERLWLHIVSKLNKKVDKVEGKDLSTNDYTNEEKAQLAILGTLVGDTAVSTQISNAVSTKADAVHIHDDRYYTEAEVDDALKFVKEASGEVITVNDSAEQSLVGLKLYGRTGQVTTTGKNLLNMSGVNGGTDAGITVTVNADGSYVMNGTATDINVNVWFKGYFDANAPTLFVLPAGTYYVAGIALYSGTAFVSNNYQINGSFFTIAEDTPITGVRCTFVTNGQTYSNRIVYPIVAAGSEAVEWEPYTGGIPGPNPNYPLPLVSPGDSGSIGVHSCGKNFLRLSVDNQSLYGVNVTKTDDGAIVLDGTAAVAAMLKIGECKLADSNYVLSTKGSTSAASGIVTLLCYDKHGTMRDISINDQLSTIVFEGSGATDVHVWWAEGTVFNNLRFYPSVERGSMVTAFEPYKDGGSVTVSTPNGLPGIPVSSGGNYTDADGQQWLCDEVDFGRGVYVQRIKSATFNGTEDWSIDGGKPMDSSTVFRADNWFRDRAIAEPVWISTSLIATRNTYGALYDGMFFVNGYGHVLVATSQYNTVDGWKACLAANPMVVMCAIETPIETQLSTSELAAYRAMTSQKPNTTVYNDAGAGMIVEYADAKIDEIEEALDIPSIDSTLSVEGAVADAKAVGDALAGKQSIGDYALKSEIPSIPVQSVNNKTGAVTLTASDVGADASGSANTALTNAKKYTDAEIAEWVGDKTVASQINTAVAGYLPITGGTITGEGTVKFIPQRSNMEGGEIVLGAPSGSPTLNSIVLDNYNGEFRVFGYPSADGTTKTGAGTPLVIDPYDKTIAGAGGGYTFDAAKYVVNSAVSMEYDSTNQCLNFVFK